MLQSMASTGAAAPSSVLLRCRQSKGASNSSIRSGSKRQPRVQAAAAADASKEARSASTRVQLGSSDLQVTRCCLGTMTWGKQNTEAEAHEQLSCALDEYNVNFIDTAGGWAGEGTWAEEWFCQRSVLPAARALPEVRSNA
jgi:hypothetical protein